MLACAGSLIWPTAAAAQEGDPDQPPAAPQTPATPPPASQTPAATPQTPPATQTFVAEETYVEQPTYVAPPTYSAEEVQTSTEEDGRDAGAFDGGLGRISLIAGTGSSVGDDYLLLGGGLGYFIADGLELGLDYEAWLIGDPTVHRLSPGARYVFHFVPVVKPYVGGFYRHAFVSNREDVDYAGARAGLYLSPGKSRLSFGAGAVYERVLDCSDGLIVECDSVYPEFTFGISL